MRILTRDLIVAFYMKIPPPMVGEAFFLIGLIASVFNLPNEVGFIGLLFAVIGAIIIYRKIKIFKYGLYVMRHGEKTEAIVSNITNIDNSDSNWSREFTLKYEASGKTLSYRFSTNSDHRTMAKGQKFPIFYLPSNPKLVFLPKKYHLYI